VRCRRDLLLLFAALSTAAVTGVAVLALVSSPGWPRVRQSFFDPDVALAALPKVAEGLWLNVRVMAVCAVVILVLSLALALARTLPGPVAFPLRAAATCEGWTASMPARNTSAT